MADNDSTQDTSFDGPAHATPPPLPPVHDDAQAPAEQQPTTLPASEQPSNPVGRPLKFQSVEELNRAIQNYFAKCDPHETQALVETGRDSKGNLLYDTRNVLTQQKPYTMAGLARALGVDRKTLLNYKNRDQFFPSIQDAKQRCEEYWEGLLASPYANGAKFNLVNNYNDEYQPWADKQVVAGDPQAPLANPYASLTTEQLRKLAEEDDGGPGPDPA